MLLLEYKSKVKLWKMILFILIPLIVLIPSSISGNGNGLEPIEPEDFLKPSNQITVDSFTRPSVTDLNLKRTGDKLNITWRGKYVTLRGYFFYLGDNSIYNYAEAASYGVTYDYWLNYNTGISLKFGGKVDVSDVNPTIKEKGFYPVFELIDQSNDTKISKSEGKVYLDDNVWIDWKDIENPLNKFNVYNKTTVYLTNNGSAFYDSVIYDPIIEVTDISIGIYNQTYYNTTISAVQLNLSEGLINGSYTTPVINLTSNGTAMALTQFEFNATIPDGCNVSHQHRTYNNSFLSKYKDSIISFFGLDYSCVDYIGNVSISNELNLLYYDNGSESEAYANNGDALRYCELTGSKIKSYNASGFHEFSICLDIRPHAEGANSVLGKYYDSGTGTVSLRGFSLEEFVSGGKLYQRLRVSGANSGVCNSQSVAMDTTPLNSWSSVCVSYDGINIRHFQNGVYKDFDACAVNQIAEGTQVMRIGTDDDGVATPNYDLDRVVFFSKNISADIVLNFHNTRENWTSYTPESFSSPYTPATNEINGTHIQTKFNFRSNDTSLTPSFFNYTYTYEHISVGVPEDTTPPTISNQINWTTNRLTYIFSAQSNENSNCSLWGNWSGTFIINQTLYNVTLNTQFNYTPITFPQDENHIWNVNCSDASFNDAFGTNITFNTNVTFVPDLCVPTINQDWILTTNLTCTNYNINTGTGYLTIKDGTSLTLDDSNLTVFGYNISKTKNEMIMNISWSSNKFYFNVSG